MPQRADREIQPSSEDRTQPRPVGPLRGLGRLQAGGRADHALITPIVTTVWAVLAGVVVLVGVVGTVLPGLPGAVLVLAGFVWLAWLDEFTHIGSGTIVLLTALTVASYAVDLAATALGARRAGASRWAVTGAFAGTLIGLFFGLPGLLLGPFVGAVAGEYLSRRTFCGGRPGPDSERG